MTLCMLSSPSPQEAVPALPQPLCGPKLLQVKRVSGVPTAFPANSGEVPSEENLLQVVYDKRPIKVFG